VTNQDLAVAIGAVVVVVLIVVAKLLSEGTTKLLPTGDPGVDCPKLALLLVKELARAGVTIGAPEVTHGRVEEAKREAAPLWKALVPGNIFFVESPIGSAHVYTATLPGSLVVRVFTDAGGVIARVVFEAALPRAFGELIYRKKFVEGLSELFSREKFEGPGAETLNGDKALLKAADAALTLSYIPPRGFSNKIVMKNGAVLLSGTTLLVDTLPRARSLGGLELGVGPVMALQRKLQG
jgi:hypothetical protein